MILGLIQVTLQISQAVKIRASGLRNSVLDRFTRSGLWCQAGCEAEDHLLRKECLAPLLLVLFAERMIGATPILSWRAAAFI